MTKLADYWTNDNPRGCWCLKDDAPQWLLDAVRDACRGDFNDWLWDECRAACLAIDDGALTPDETHSHADSQVDIYTQDLFAWAADMCLTSTWSEAEEQAEDFGVMTAKLQAIQYYAIDYIANVIVNAWKESQKDEES